MTKPLNFGDEKSAVDDAPRKIPNAGDVKKFIDRALKLEEELAQNRADLKSVYDDAHNEGIDRKALKVVVKHKKNPVSFEHRQEVNELLKKVSAEPLYHAVEGNA